MKQSKKKLQESKPKTFVERWTYRIVVFQFLFFDVLKNIARADNHRARTRFWDVLSIALQN